MMVNIVSKNIYITGTMIINLIIIFVVCYAYGKDTQLPVEKNIVTLDKAALKIANIEVSELKPTVLPNLISTPGEVIPNPNLTTKVTSRLAAQVEKRYVQEGEHVKVGQQLLELSSIDMAKTQGDLILAAQEWQRVKNLGKDAISAKRFAEAEVTYQRSYSSAIAYGMTKNEINELLKTQNPTNTKGKFKLLAPREGTVFNTSFTDGELIEAGKDLLHIVEESTVWVDAKLPPNMVNSVKMGDIAHVLIGDNDISGKVIQIHHQLDEVTRTRSVRVEVPNKDDLLHSGQYVNCKIESGKSGAVLAMPIDAVLKTSDGDWAIYIEKQPEKFQQIEVKMVEMIDNKAVIEGVAPGTRVVTQGAFFIHAELNKARIDSHGH